MFGLFMVGIVIIIFTKEYLSNAYFDGQSRKKAKDNGFRYYTDSQGNRRRVDNNHKVYERMTNYDDGSYDQVDIDAFTGEILRNYSQEKRNQEAIERRKIEEENRKRKQEAIRNGEYYYKSEELGKFGFLQKEEVYGYVSRRCSDDLMVCPKNGMVRDAKCRFILKDNERYYIEFPRIYSLEHTIEKNVLKCNPLRNRHGQMWYTNLVTNEDWYPTKEELMEYIRKIKPIGYEEMIKYLSEQ